MRTNIFKMLCLAGAILLAACSSEENIEDNGKKVDVAKALLSNLPKKAINLVHSAPRHVLPCHRKLLIWAMA